MQRMRNAAPLMHSAELTQCVISSRAVRFLITLDQSVRLAKSLYVQIKNQK